MVGHALCGNPSAEHWDLLVPTSREVDLRDTPSVISYLKSKRPDAIIHAAGRVGGIAANIASPVSFLDDNLLIGRNVVFAARSAGVRYLLNLASTCVYPRAAPNPLREEMILTGELEPTNEGYALAKLTTLRLCQYVRKEAPDLFYKTLIPCNLYGPYDKFDPGHSHLVPAIIHKVHEAVHSQHADVEIWGDGTARREFLYVNDLADAVFKALEDIEHIPDLMNIGVGSDLSINDYYATIAKVVGWRGQFIHNLEKPVGMLRKLCDVSLQTDWGWKPRTSLLDGVRATYDYYLRVTT